MTIPPTTSLTDTALVPVSLKARFESLDAERFSVMERLRDSAALTCPFILPKKDQEESEDRRNSYQSEGNYGAISLASKITLTLFPPNVPFFRYELDPATRAELRAILTAGNNDVAAAEKTLDDILRVRSSAITSAISKGEGARYKLFLTILSTLCVGQGLLYIPEEDSDDWRFFRLDQYVVRRGGAGKLMEIIIREQVERSELPETVRNAAPPSGGSDTSIHKSTDNVELFTTVKRTAPDTFETWQEVGGGLAVPGSYGSFKKSNLPWIVATCLLIDGRDYAEGYATQFLGTLRSLHMNSRSLAFQGLLATRKFLVMKPGMNDFRLFQKAQTGDALPGDPEGIKAIGFDNVPELRVAMEVVNGQKRDVGAFFMTYRSVQRDGERVTAEEIRMLAGELDSANAGIYSEFTDSLQKPVLGRVEARLDASRRLPKFPLDSVTAKMTAGVEGLGDAAEANKITQWLSVLAQFLPSAVQTAIKGNVVAIKLGKLLGVDTDPLVKSDEEMAAESTNAAMLNVAPGVATEAAKAAFSPQSQPTAGA